MSRFSKKLLILKKNMQMKKDYSLQGLNTMGFNFIAKYFCEVNSLDDIKKLIDDKTFKESKKLFLGGGSNILFTEEYFDGVVIHSNLKGITFVDGQQSVDNEFPQFLNSSIPQFLTVRCMSGEVWQSAVWCC